MISAGRSLYCARGAGLPIEAIIEYVKLFQMGTPSPRVLSCLRSAAVCCLSRKKKTDSTLIRLDYKISRYEHAVKTGSPE